MKKINIGLLCFLTIFFIVNSKLVAQHIEKEHNNESNDETHEHHLHKHHIAVFNGATTNFNHQTIDYTVGLDYEYRVSEVIGIGLSGEYVAAEYEEIMGGIPFFIHPYKGDKIIVEPMFLYAAEPQHVADSHATTVATAKKEVHFTLRIGTGYDFHLGKFSAGPTINLDIGKTNALVYGLSLGVGF